MFFVLFYVLFVLGTNQLLVQQTTVFTLYILSHHSVCHYSINSYWAQSIFNYLTVHQYNTIIAIRYYHIYIQLYTFDHSASHILY